MVAGWVDWLGGEDGLKTPTAGVGVSMSQVYDCRYSQPTRAGIRRPGSPGGHRRDKILAASHALYNTG